MQHVVTQHTFFIPFFRFVKFHFLLIPHYFFKFFILSMAFTFIYLYIIYFSPYLMLKLCFLPLKKQKPLSQIFIFFCLNWYILNCLIQNNIANLLKCTQFNVYYIHVLILHRENLLLYSTLHTTNYFLLLYTYTHKLF